MPTLGFLTTMQARPGRSADVAEFLATTAKPLADEEPGTLLWFAFQSGPATFGVFDIFASEDAREFHLHGEVRKALDAHSAELLSEAPVITALDVLASKLPAPWPEFV